MRAAELGAREQRAMERLTAAVAGMAALAGLDATDLHVQGRDRAVAALKQRERLADFLEAALAELAQRGPVAEAPVKSKAKGKPA